MLPHTSLDKPVLGTGIFIFEKCSRFCNGNDDKHFVTKHEMILEKFDNL